MRTALALPFLLLLASCSDHPLAGHWAPEGKKGLVFQFQTSGDKLIVHVDRPDGSHQDLNGTYKWADGTLTLQYSDGPKVEHWSGKFTNGKLDLKGDGGTMTLVPTEAAHH